MVTLGLFGSGYHHHMARVLILTASMGSGHDGVAAELARRLRALGHDIEVIDLLTLFPLRLGRAMRASYITMLRFAPWAYALIYWLFFKPSRFTGPGPSPAVVLAARRLRRVLGNHEPDAVVSTFHLAGMVAGRLVREGQLSALSIVVITEAFAHRLWREPGTDLYLCAYPDQAQQLQRDLGIDSITVAPIVRPEFWRPVNKSPGCEGPTTVLVSTGSLGIGKVERVAATLTASGRYLPVVLCGRNRRLADRLRNQGFVALDWIPNVAEVMSTVSAMVENSGGGLTCWEAFAVGLPVISFDPLPGHGRAGAFQLADAGLTMFCANEGELLATLDDVTSPESCTRERLQKATGALFGDDAAMIISDRIAASEERR